MNGKLLALGAMLGLGAGAAVASQAPGDYRPISDNEGMRNLFAFCAALRQLESGDNYRALVYGGTFSSMRDHPYLTGEWPGVRRKDDGRLTTAAGAYQITKTTWLDFGGVDRFGSFNEAAQDACAYAIIERENAMADIQAGRIETAISKLSGRWEALKVRSRDEIFAVYFSNGGVMA